MSLPLLDAMSPAFASAVRTARETPGEPRRFFGICNNLGLLPDQFFPQEPGRGYALSPYLEVLKEHRDDFTVFSGVWHPEVDGGHPADNCFLTVALTRAARDSARYYLPGSVPGRTHRVSHPLPRR